jgi:hypothetical protein
MSIFLHPIVIHSCNSLVVFLLRTRPFIYTTLAFFGGGGVFWTSSSQHLFVRRSPTSLGSSAAMRDSPPCGCTQHLSSHYARWSSKEPILGHQRRRLVRGVWPSAKPCPRATMKNISVDLLVQVSSSLSMALTHAWCPPLREQH